MTKTTVTTRKKVETAAVDPAVKVPRKRRSKSDLTTVEAALNISGLGADAVRLFLDDLARHPLPSPAEQVELAKRVRAGDETAKSEMVAANLRLVVHWARRYQDRVGSAPRLPWEGELLGRGYAPRAGGIGAPTRLRK